MNAAQVSLRARHPRFRSLVYRLATRLVYGRRVRVRLAALLHLHDGEHLRRKFTLGFSEVREAVIKIACGSTAYL
jgi:hypothetical protein